MAVEQQPPEVLALIIADHVYRDDSSGKFFSLGMCPAFGAAQFLDDLIFPEPGEYRLQLYGAGQLLRERRLILIPLENPQ